MEKIHFVIKSFDEKNESFIEGNDIHASYHFVDEPTSLRLMI